MNNVETYGWETAEGMESNEIISPKVIEILKEIPHAKRVLDLGAGNGCLCSDLAQAGYDVVGVDYDANGVVIAKAAYPNIPFYNYGVQDDPNLLLEHEKKFDVVVSTEVIEHLYTPSLLLKYAHAVMKDNSHIIISTPYHGYLKNLLLSLFNKWDFHHTVLWDGGHIKFWSRETLTKLLEGNGFRVVEFKGVGRAPYMWKSMILLAQKQ